MEEFKRFDEITVADERHELLDQITGTHLTLEILYEAISEIEVSENAPEEIRSEFNVARNLAIYTWYSYSLDPMVQLKTYMLIERSLKLKYQDEKSSFKKLVKKAVSDGLVRDIDFEHVQIEHPEDTKYVENMVDVLPRLRNVSAHGHSFLVQRATQSLRVCRDWINQIFREGT